MNNYSKVTSESWISRIGGSLKNVIGGIVLLLVSIFTLWWNEGRAVRTARGLEEGIENVHSLDNPVFETTNNKKLIHIHGEIVTDHVLTDPEFDVEVHGIKLIRSVEMYQWKETVETTSSKKTGGGKKTKKEYSYDKVWSSEYINSNKFEVTSGHQNPSQLPYGGYSENAENVYLGDFEMTDNILDQVSNYQGVDINEGNLPTPSASIVKETIEGKPQRKIFIGSGTNSNPNIGDVKVSFIYVPEGEYSIIGQQSGSTIQAYETESDTELLLVSSGHVSAKEMFDNALESNNFLTWIFRLVGFVLMFVSFIVMTSLLETVADIIPILGSIIGLGIKVFAGVVSFFLSFLIIGIAWIYYRPILGGILIAIGLGVALFFYKKSLNNSRI